MKNQLKPIVGQWYALHGTHDLIEVIAVETAADVIELQDFEGAIDEVDFESWREMDLERVEPPEDWTGPYDDIGPDDQDYASGAEEVLSDWRLPLDTMRGPDDTWREAEGADDSVQNI